MARVLVVDDESQVRAFLLFALNHQGYEVRAVSSAAEAMAQLSSESYDLVLSDVMMPGGDGHQLVRWVVANHPSTRCILMTGFDVECDDCPYAGRCVYLRKPFGVTEVTALIARALERQAS